MPVQSIPISQIYTLPEFNPRRSFDDDYLKSLSDSIVRTKLIHPIVVRPAPSKDGDFHLVVGECRWRACVLAGLDSIDADVLDCSLEEARLIAIEENDKRKNISVGEEAIAAQKVLDAVEGDRAVAAKELGWSASKLNSRLLLLHAVPEVLDALAREDILIGHAEDLSGLPEVTQRGSLKAIIDNKVSVKEFKARVKNFAIPLSTALFDVAGCNGCPHNTKGQASLFGDPLEGSNCLNRECFNTKTQTALEAKREELGEKFNIVVLTTEKPDENVRALVKDGSGGVGPTQYRACQQCANFGARIENRLNGSTGKVTDSLCFNLTCNTEKVAAFKAESAPVSENTTTKSAGASGKGASKGKASAKKVPVKATKAPELTKAAKAVISAQVRSAAGEIVSADSRLQKALVVEALTGHLGGSTPLDELIKLDESALEKLILETTIKIASADSLRAGGGCDGYFQQQMKRALSLAKNAAAEKESPRALCAVTAEFLAALPKAAIAGILEEVGFEKWFADKHDDGAYKALMAKKKVDLPKAIMDAGFDWAGKTPKLLEAFLKNP